LICISLIAKDVEHFFMYLFVLLLRTDQFICPFIGLFGFLHLTVLNSFYILDINPLSDE
jgi:hypothetical protein